jgi:hypothetical protein
VLVWHPLRLIYLRVPKSANSSIRKSIPNGVQKRLDIRRLEERFPGYLTFSFVRNPWARFVSTFTDKVRATPTNEANFVDGVHDEFRALSPDIRAGMPFAEFAEIVCSISDEDTEKHLKSQCYFLVRNGVIIPRFVGKVESMSEDWSRLAQRVGFHRGIGHKNRSEHVHYAKYYPDSRLRSLVGDRYRDDVETFGYDFGD